jgi:hypothetical protein
MRVLFELGRLLLADVCRAAGRGLASVGDAIDGELADVGEPVAPGPLVTPEAAQMVARAPVEPEPDEPEPLKGSLAARGDRVGQPWAR